MNFRIRNILVSAFCLAALTASGQITTREGYIISLENDTIFGRLEYANSGYLNKCIFGKGDSPKIEWFKPGEIKEFYVNPDIRFSSIKYQGEDMFLKVLSNGKINLYSDILNLYISNNTDSVVKLAGGKEYYTVNGKQYSQKVNTFRTQIWELTFDGDYYQRIEELNYDLVKITALIKEINGRNNEIDRKAYSGRTIHESHFGFETGMSFNTLIVKNIPYRFDTLRISMDSHDNFLPGSDPYDYFKANSWFAGLNYKWKTGRGNSYLSGTLYLEWMPGNNTREHGVIHSTTMNFGMPGSPYYIDTVGTVTDTYLYNLISLGFPVAFHKEMSYNRLRPFFNVGVLARLNFQKHGTLTREIFFSESTVTKEIKIHIPAYMAGVKVGVGIRYIIDMNYSFSAGVSIEAMSGGSDGNGIRSIINKRTYLSFNY